MDSHDRAQLIDRFSAAWQAGDLEAVMALMADDCVFRASLGPEPGATFRGVEDVRRGFALFMGSGGADLEVHTETEEPLISDQFAVTRWTSRARRTDGAPMIVSACDILGFEGDRIAFKDTYRKVTSDLPPA